MSRLYREDSKLPSEGWSGWKRAMVPFLPRNGYHNFNDRSSNQPGYWCVNIDHAFDDYDCGIYEWQARGTYDWQPSRVVVYVGSTCRGKPGAIEDRIKEYCRTGSQKERLINKALRNGYELWVRAKATDEEGEAEDEENELLSKYNYAWNKRLNGNRTRNVLPE